MMPLPDTGASFFWITFKPQKVKNIVTCMPIEAPVVATMKAASARSSSPLKSTIVILS